GHRPALRLVVGSNSCDRRDERRNCHRIFGSEVVIDASEVLIASETRGIREQGVLNVRDSIRTAAEWLTERNILTCRSSWRAKIKATSHELTGNWETKVGARARNDRNHSRCDARIGQNCLRDPIRT